MFVYGNASRKKLNTCDPRLVQIAELVLSWQIVDITIIWGHRGEEAQNQAYLAGNSSKQWPDSKHNSNPSPALDFGPWINGRIPWNDTHAFALVGGLFMAAARQLGYKIRYGGDWDMDGETTDQNLMDWGHVELVD